MPSMFAILILVSVILENSYGDDSKAGFLLVVNSRGQKDNQKYCLTGIAPSTTSITSLKWKPISDESIYLKYSFDRSQHILLLEQTKLSLGLNEEYSPKMFGILSSDSQDDQYLSSFAKRYPDVVFARLPVSDFDELFRRNREVISAEVEQAELPTLSLGHALLVFSPVYVCAFLSLIIGSLMVLASWETLLSHLKERATQKKSSTWLNLLVIFLLVVVGSVSLLMYYFFYDVAVYIAIALYCLIGVISTTSVLAFWIMYFFNAATTQIHCSFKLFRRQVKCSFHVTKLCICPFAVVLMVTWLVYRNDRSIGWPIQSFVGILIVAHILSSSISFPSLKLITLLFIVFLLFDVFFVFITPFFFKKDSSLPATTPVPPTPMPLQRHARSISDPKSIMEAVATGSAGKSNESIPLSFRFRILISAGPVACSKIIMTPLLGYGDAVFPGFLISYVAFFDSVWNIRFKRNLICSLIGYLIGIGVTQLMLILLQKAQPALLYLCPCTLLFTALTCCLFGGLEELRRMWTGAVPVLRTSLDLDSCRWEGDGHDVSELTTSVDTVDEGRIYSKSDPSSTI